MPEIDLSIDEQAQRLRIYIGESDKWRGQALYAVLLEKLRSQGLAGATVVRGVAGFGARSRIHTAAILELSEDLPLIIDVVDNTSKIQAAVEMIKPMVREGLITIENVQVVKYTHRYLNPLPADKLVEEVIQQKVDVLTPDQPIAEAWRKMLQTRIKAFPVVDAQHHAVGILTDEDLLERAGIQQRLAVALRLDKSIINTELQELENSPLRVQDVMSSPVVTIAASEHIGNAVARMVEQDLKRMVVINEEGRIAGILSRLDILRLVTKTTVPAAPEPVPGSVVETLQDILIAPVPSVQEDDPLSDIVDRLVESEGHKVIVVDDENRPLGLISDSDAVGRIQPPYQKGILNSLRRLGQPPLSKLMARDLMSPGVTSLPPGTPIVEAVQQMLAQGRKWIIVVDQEGRAIGFVDRETIFRALAVK